MNLPRTIRVLLVDDHAVVRRGLRGFLELIAEIEIVGEADDGAAAVDAARRLEPDVVLMDLVLPTLDGIEAIAAIKGELPGVQVVALTSYAEEDRVTAALEAGASGFLLKDADADEVVSAIRAAAGGDVHLSPPVARMLAARMRRRQDRPPGPPLTQRERQVLGLIARGLSNRAIAAHLAITERTARTHVSNILGKLELASRTQAALYAIEHRLVPGD